MKKIIAKLSFLKRKYFLSFFKRVLNFVIIFQLSTYPYLSYSNPEKTSHQRNLEDINSVNKNAETLSEWLFGEKQNSGYHTSHPLDFYGLLGQTAQGPKLTPEEEKARKKEEKEAREQARREQEKLSPRSFEGVIINTVGKSFESEEEKEDRKKKEKEARREKEKLFPRSFENVIIEIVDQSIEDNSFKDLSFREAQVQTILSHPNKHSIVQRLVPQDLALQEDSIFINPGEKKLSFRLSLHGKVINTFPQNIAWIAFFNNYLLFLEPSKVSDKKALISFIDLKYFEKAIGKTSLPIFHIPVHFEKVNASSAELLSPILKKHLNDTLYIGNIQLTKKQIDFLSLLQQSTFNLIVSLLSPENSQVTKEHIREILNSYYNPSDDINTLPENARINNETRDLVSLFLDSRIQLGSKQNPSGRHGQLQRILFSQDLDTEKDFELFKENIQQDISFQTEVSRIHEQMTHTRGLITRFFALINHLTRPQPLGTPKIEKALGLLANSLSLKAENNRWKAFQEGISQFLHPKKNRILLGSSVLAGFAGLGIMYQDTFYNNNPVNDFLKNLWKVVNSSTNASFEWVVNPSEIYSTYIEGDNWLHLLTGIGALAGFFITILGIIHFTVNTIDLIKEKKKDVSWKTHFMSYESRERHNFFNNLTIGEKDKLGIQIKINLGNSKETYIFKTQDTPSSFYSALNDTSQDLTLELKLEFKNQEEQNTTTFLTLQSQNTKKETDLQILIETEKSNPRAFSLSQEDYNLLFDNKGNLKSNTSFTNLNLSGKNLNIKGGLSNLKFTPEEDAMVKEALAKVQSKGESTSEKNSELQYSLFDFNKEQSQNSSLKDIKTLFREGLQIEEFKNLSREEIRILFWRALGEFFFGYSSWDKSFRVLGLFWNQFFLFRSMVVAPGTSLKAMYYANYLKVSLEGHSPSFFNGGKQNRLSRILIKTRADYKKLKDFEAKVKLLEKEVLKEVITHAYLALAKKFGQDKKGKPLSDLNPKNIKYNELIMFYNDFINEAFQESMKELLKGTLDKDILDKSNNLNNSTLKIEAIRNSQSLSSITSETISQTVNSVIKEQEIEEKALKKTNYWIKRFFKRINFFEERNNQKFLDPNSGTQMNRYNKSIILLNDPVARARATRAVIAQITRDKPIQLLYMFLLFLGVDQGTLQILHDQAFTKESFFYLGRQSVWALFFGIVLTEIFASVWLKTQTDSRLYQTKGLDNIPSDKDLQKGYLRWLWKQFRSEDNTYMKNLIEAKKLVVANFVPSIVLYSIIWFPTIGKFDLDFFVGMYALAIFYYAFNFKLENTFEKSTIFSIKDLVEKGELPLNNKEFEKLFTHLQIQEYLFKDSDKKRRAFNTFKAALYENLAQNFMYLFQAVTTTEKSSAFIKTLLDITPSGDKTLTQIHSDHVDDGEEMGREESSKKSNCKSVFDKNKTDVN
ncbi:MAG: hypothetical protein GDA46_06690 [Bdellovibrionales bacterium]|nr:hypothetical protein [Bdellovibrionales bacterium]